MQVKEIMKKPIVIEKNISLKEAAHIMSTKQLRALIVVEKNKVKGIITHTDLVNNFAQTGKIASILQKNVITVEADDEISTALTLMRDNNIHHLPVVKKTELVGVIASIDIAANAEELDEDFFF